MDEIGLMVPNGLRGSVPREFTVSVCAYYLDKGDDTQCGIRDVGFDW